MFGGLISQDIGRHQKKQKKQSTISQNIGRHQKKQKKTKISNLWGSRILSRCCILFFSACQSFVHLVFVFFLVNVWWLWSLKTLAGTKKSKKNKAQSHKTLAGTKKNKKKTKISNLWGSRILSRCWDFFFFFWCLPMFCEIGFVFLFFLGACASLGLFDVDKERQYSQLFAVFCAHFHATITSPWSPKVAVPILN